jgi:hypothetical protein
LADPQTPGNDTLLYWLKFNPAANQRRQDQPRIPRPRGANRRRFPEPPAPTPGSIAAVINQIERCGPSLSQERATRWAKQLFTPYEVEAWLSAGLRTDDLELVVELRSLGIPPKAMDWVVRKETVLDRIRLRNYSARAIAGMLRREHLLDKIPPS